MRLLALDIGGANIKMATALRADDSTCAEVRAWSTPFALWREPGELAGRLAKPVRDAGAVDAVLVTMTGELCDCFADRVEGVRAIVAAASGAVGPRAMRVWSTAGRFVDAEGARARPLEAASANWHALAAAIGRRYPVGRTLLIDMGSTTTDIVAIVDGQPRPRGRTDHARMISGELVYTGASRTPLMAIGREPRCAEYFATMADALIVAGDAAPDDNCFDTPDGRALSMQACATRVLRMVGGDLSTHTVDDANRVARSFISEQRRMLTGPIRGVLKQLGDAERIVVTGSGDALACAAARDAETKAQVIRLADEVGRAESDAACAWALLHLWDGK